MLKAHEGSKVKCLYESAYSLIFRLRFTHNSQALHQCDVLRIITSSIACLFLIGSSAFAGESTKEKDVNMTNKHIAEKIDYVKYVKECLDMLMEYGTDRYGKVHAPILVSILDVESRICPENPASLDERWRVKRRGRRNPAGANMLMDQPILKTMFLTCKVTGEDKYAEFARTYMDYYMKNLVDEKGFFRWGWHRHYDVYQDIMTGHNLNPHELNAAHLIAWDKLWAVNPEAVRKEIEAIWMLLANCQEVQFNGISEILANGFMANG